MAKVSAIEIQVDVSAIEEAGLFIGRHRHKLEQPENEHLMDRLTDLLEHHQIFVCVQEALPGGKFLYRFEPSYPLMEIMAELAR